MEGSLHRIDAAQAVSQQRYTRSAGREEGDLKQSYLWIHCGLNKGLELIKIRVSTKADQLLWMYFVREAAKRQWPIYFSLHNCIICLCTKHTHQHRHSPSSHPCCCWSCVHVRRGKTMTNIDKQAAESQSRRNIRLR